MNYTFARDVMGQYVENVIVVGVEMNTLQKDFKLLEKNFDAEKGLVPPPGPTKTIYA
jgi:hypothetical protein